MTSAIVGIILVGSLIALLSVVSVVNMKIKQKDGFEVRGFKGNCADCDDSNCSLNAKYKGEDTDE